MNTTQGKTLVYAAAIIGSILCGLTFIGSKIALTALDAIEILAVRWTMSLLLFFVLVMFGVIKVKYRGKPVRKLLPVILIHPCINMICETCGIDLTTASESAIIYAMIPLAVVLLSLVVFKRHITWMTGSGIVLSFIGVTLAIAFSDSFSLAGKATGYLFLIGMVVTAALFTILSRDLSKWFSAMERTFAMAFAGTIWFNGLNVLRGNGINSYITCFQEPKAGLAVLFLGVVASFICYGIFNYVVGHIPAPQASSIQVNIITLTGVATGILFQGDSFGWYTVVGMILIVIGVITSNAQADMEKPSP